MLSTHPLITTMNSLSPVRRGVLALSFIVMSLCALAPLPLLVGLVPFSYGTCTASLYVTATMLLAAIVAGAACYGQKNELEENTNEA